MDAISSLIIGLTVVAASAFAGAWWRRSDDYSVLQRGATVGASAVLALMFAYDFGAQAGARQASSEAHAHIISTFQSFSEADREPDPAIARDKSRAAEKQLMTFAVSDAPGPPGWLWWCFGVLLIEALVLLERSPRRGTAVEHTSHPEQHPDDRS